MTCEGITHCQFHVVWLLRVGHLTALYQALQTLTLTKQVSLVWVSSLSEDRCRPLCNLACTRWNHGVTLPSSSRQAE